MPGSAPLLRSSEFYKNAGHNDGYIGYYKVDEASLEENFNAAVEVLKKYYTFDEASGKFTDFPTYFPVREDVVENEAWATDPSTYVCNGMYTLAGWDHNSLITLQKNPNHPDADSVTMDTIEFYLSDDANNMLTNFKNGDWDFIDDVPTNEIAALKADYPDEFKVEGQIGTYYVCWNINENILPEGSTLTGVEAENAKAEIRKAIALLFDRNYIVNDVAQGGQVPASSFVAMGMTEPDGSEFYKNAGHNDGYIGYYKVDEASLEVPRGELQRRCRGPQEVLHLRRGLRPVHRLPDHDLPL